MPEELSIVNISGVDCYEKDGVAWLNLEAVARGLGFTQTQTKNGVEYTSIRWERIDQYLAEIGFPHSRGKTDYIPENIFYRLAMKAKNETAEKFQALVADEIIPAIRKTGSYTAAPPKPMTLAEQLLQYAQVAVEQERKVNALAARMDEQQQTLEKAVSVFSLPTVEVEHWRDEMNTHVSRICETYGLSQQVFRGDTYAELEEQANVILSSRVKRKQDRMKKAGAKARERAAVTKLFVISEDEKLRHMYEAIVRKHESQLCVQSSRPSRAS